MKKTISDRQPPPWALLVVPAVENNISGIYSWTVDGVGTYVGKSRNLGNRLREYPNNIRKLTLKLPYRKSKPSGFRKIHRELLSGILTRRVVKCQIIELCDCSKLAERERYWIGKIGSLNGRLKECEND